MMPPILKDPFGDDFAWGVSAAAFQTEGAVNADGKSESIWDVFSMRKGKIARGENALTTCDFYDRYRQDIDLVKQLNIPNFRFSIAWSRILPNGEGEINQAGVDHYNHVINYCLEQGIDPWLTIYHWDLPQKLEDQGGWTNRKIINWFTNYAVICAEHFGDRVKHWMIMNEPAVFTGAGYFFGIHAPGRKGLRSFLPAVHHAAMSLASAAKKLKNILPDANIGSTFSCSAIEPRTQKSRDIAAAKRADALINRLFIDPVYGKGYPWDDVAVLKGLKKYVLPGDEELLPADLDFIGLQNYTREVVAYSLFTPYLHAKLIEAATRKVPVTEMGWEVYPPAIKEVLHKFAAYNPGKPIYVTENGAAFPDTVINDKVDDHERVAYLQAHIAKVLEAKCEGVNVKGYFVWTLTDNFEWAEGYRPRFGLIYIDFATQRRIIKSSGKWYAGFLAEKV